jgi:hypothetical protein
MAGRTRQYGLRPANTPRSIIKASLTLAYRPRHAELIGGCARELVCAREMLRMWGQEGQFA